MHENSFSGHLSLRKVYFFHSEEKETDIFSLLGACLMILDWIKFHRQPTNSSVYKKPVRGNSQRTFSSNIFPSLGEVLQTSCDRAVVVRNYGQMVGKLVKCERYYYLS